MKNRERKKGFLINRIRIVWSWCDTVIAGPIVGIEDGDTVTSFICYYFEVLKPGRVFSHLRPDFAMS